MFHKPSRGTKLNLNGYGMDDNGDVIGVQHARQASKKEKKNDINVMKMLKICMKERIQESLPCIPLSGTWTNKV